MCCSIAPVAINLSKIIHILLILNFNNELKPVIFFHKNHKKLKNWCYNIYENDTVITALNKVAL